MTLLQVEIRLRVITWVFLGVMIFGAVGSLLFAYNDVLIDDYYSLVVLFAWSYIVGIIIVLPTAISYVIINQVLDKRARQNNLKVSKE